MVRYSGNRNSKSLEIFVGGFDRRGGRKMLIEKPGETRLNETWDTRRQPIMRFDQVFPRDPRPNRNVTIAHSSTDQACPLASH